MATQQGTVCIIQNSIPVRYNQRVRVVPCSPDRVPALSVDILYLIAQALPRPKWVYNLARVNKQSWHYLQPALFQCEVTYEARLEEHFGIDYGAPSKNRLTDKRTDDQKEAQDHCRHGLKITICEECGDRIAIEKVIFRADWRAPFLHEAGTADVTALHWACAKGADGVPAGLKAIRAASVHQPSYINGTGLILRNLERSSIGSWGYSQRKHGNPSSGEIPSPLSLAVAFGSSELCEALIKAGCNVNLLQPGEFGVGCNGDPPQWGYKARTLFKIHDKCSPELEGANFCRWRDDSCGFCQTAGQVAVFYEKPALLKLLLDGGLDPLRGTEEPCLSAESLIHVAVYDGNIPAIKLLLDRYPELSQDCRGDGWTPLHSLTRIGLAGIKDSLEELKTIGSALVQNGASLEAVNMRQQFVEPGTPLQHAIRRVGEFSTEGLLRVPQVFIELGSVWDQPLRSWIPHVSILYHCISRATIRRSLPEHEQSNQVGYGRVVKAIVESGRGRMNLMVPRRKIFLDAFRELARKSVSVPDLYDAFTTEIVGKLLLSTGITPDASLVSKWTQSLLKIQTSNTQTISGCKMKLWEKIMLDQPTDYWQQETKPKEI